MTKGPGEHENVPDAMVVRYGAGSIEDQSHGIEQSAGYQPGESSLRQGFAQGFQEGHNQPAQGKVEERSDDPQPVGPDGFEDDTSHSQAPDDSEQAPSGRAIHSHQGKRGVGSGNDQENADMIEDPENVTYSRITKGVIEGRKTVEQGETKTVKGTADDQSGFSRSGRSDHQEDQADQARHRPQPMRPAVENLLSLAVMDQSLVKFLGHDLPEVYSNHLCPGIQLSGLMVGDDGKILPNRPKRILLEDNGMIFKTRKFGFVC